MDLQPFRVSNDALGDPVELRQRFADEGYLFLRKFFDRDKLWRLRLEILEVIEAGGWIEPPDLRMDVWTQPRRVPKVSRRTPTCTPTSRSCARCTLPDTGLR